MLTEGDDYYLDDNGNLVFTEEYHLKRGTCCKNKCRHCPWNYGREKERRKGIRYEVSGKSKNKLH